MDKGSQRSEGQANRGKPREALDRQYGEIGISAVAAAMRYQGDHTSAAQKQQGDHQDDADQAA